MTAIGTKPAIVRSSARSLRAGPLSLRVTRRPVLATIGLAVAVFAAEEDLFFPARAVLPRAQEIFPDLALAESLVGCRHVPSKAALERVNERLLAFLAGSVGA